MKFTSEEMVKSLTSLIDETLEEIEEIKKSKFAASEISLGDDKSGIADKSKNGKLEAKKAEEDEDEDEEDDMDKADCMDKAEDDMDKAEDEDEDEDEEQEDEEHERREKHMKKMKKSLEESEELMKSYVDSRFNDIESAISRLVDVVESIADAPVQRKGVPSGFSPLHKSQEEVEPLSKSQVANQLFELKKSGKQVDSADIFKVETGNNLTVLEIANKYGLR